MGRTDWGEVLQLGGPVTAPDGKATNGCAFRDPAFMTNRDAETGWRRPILLKEESAEM